ncbi:MAG: glycoside hydrolase 100 family protein [Acidimicrobiia bacterium]|nr:glycoside hydrolase 100 family protein [Acidimicrobiia bacterium]
MVFDAEVVHAHRSLLPVSDPRYRNQILDRITVGQMTLPGYATMPTRAVGIDLRLWAELSDENRRRFRDRIGAHRHDLLLIGISESPTAPDGIEPDYLVERNGAWILRMPASEPVLNAPAGSLADVLLHLTEEFLILPSTMALLSGADLQLGDGSQSWNVELINPGDGDGLIAALDRFLTFAPATLGSDVCDEGLVKAIESLHRNVTPLGFTAASLADNRFGLEDANYASVWARDGVMTGLWTLGLDEEVFTDAFRATVRLLAAHQTPAGQIPSYVLIESQRPDYSGIGGIASIDSVLWFVIGTVRLAFHTADRTFAQEMLPSIERAMAWLAAHDSNNDSLIEIPESSDWMDLFPRSYNVLYDEVLWYRACHDTASLQSALGGDGSGWKSLGETIGHRIVDLFWPTARQLMDLAGPSSGRYSVGEARYLLAQVTPFDFSWRCDVLGNLLAALHNLLDDDKCQRLFDFLWGVGINQPYPVACLYPAVNSGADDWKDYFLINFMNLPHHYHNGGLWPFIGGLWVRYLSRIGRQELAHRELQALAETCRQGLRGEWEFNEWLHGLTGRPMGKAHQAWSAASYAQAYLSIHRTAPSPDVTTLDHSRLE